MIDKSIFLDTNILVYGHDREAGHKHTVCKKLIRSCWNSEKLPFLSIQVIQEFFVNVHKKTKDFSLSRQLATDYLSWNVIDNDASLVLDAFKYMEEKMISFWDSAIIAAANRAGVEELWTEDLNTGQIYGDVKAVNPITAYS